MTTLAMQTWLPFWTLFKKEVIRFMVAPAQTLIAPIINSALFLFVFGVSMGNHISVMPHFSYAQFVIPGLVLMGVINNSFANSSSSLFFSRYIGNIVDLLVTPIGASHMILAYTLAAMLRGMMVGVAVLIISTYFSPLPWAHPGIAFLIAALSAFMLSQLGIIAALYSETFEAISMYTNFLLLPLLYLGGMFYPISILPPLWGNISKLNPLFYSIDGFRHAILGQGDVSLALSIGVSTAFSIALFLWAAILIGKGYKLRQ